MKKYATEEDTFPAGASKWEVVLHGKKWMHGNSLNNPVLDIHYNAREAGVGQPAPRKFVAR